MSSSDSLYSTDKKKQQQSLSDSSPSSSSSSTTSTPTSAPNATTSSSSSPTKPSPAVVPRRSKKPLPPKSSKYPFYLGGLAASFSACFTHPLDLTKTRMQTASQKQGMLGTILTTARTEGIMGMYVGLSASLLRQMTYSVARFGVYDVLKSSFRSPTEKAQNKPLPAWKMAAAASIAGAIGGLAGNPADIILVRMTSDLQKPPEAKFNYRHALDGVIRMGREEGLTSFFRGVVPNVIRAVLMNASQLATYDFFKDGLLSSGYFHEGTPLHITASALAGTVATTVCSPADVIKARVMSANGTQGNLIAKLSKTLKAEGVGFLFRGWTPAWIRLSPNTVITFVTLEKLRLLVDWSREKARIISDSETSS